MDCSNYKSNVHYASCWLYNHYAPQINFCVVLIAVTIAVWQLRKAGIEDRGIETHYPLTCCLVACSMVVPAIYSYVLILEWMLSETGKANSESTGKDGLLLPFLFLVIGWFAVIAILPFLVTLLIMFLSHIEEIPKKKAQTVGIPMTQTPRTANGYDAAPQLEASAPQEPLAATVFDAAEYGVPPEANDEESASDEAEGFTPSSSESQSVEEAVQIQATENRTRKDGIPLAMDDDTSVWAGVSEQSRRSSESNESGPGVSMEDYNGPSPLDAPGTSGYSDDHTALLTEQKPRIQDEWVEHDQLEQERGEQKRIEEEQMKQEHIEKERLKQERLKQERINQERLRRQQLQQQQIRQQRLQQQQAQKQEECVMS